MGIMKRVSEYLISSQKSLFSQQISVTIFWLPMKVWIGAADFFNLG